MNNENASIPFSDGFYKGDAVDGIPHGKGKKTYPDGRVEEGRWENDVFLG